MKPKPVDLGGAAAILAILVAAWFLGVRAQIAKTASFLEEEASMKKALSASGSLADREARMNRNTETLTEALAAYERQMPATPELEAFIRQLGEIARDTGLVIRRVQPAAIVERERYSVLPVQLDAEATFPVFYGFLFKMADVPRINKVDAMTVSASEAGLDVRLTLHIFMSRQKA